MSGVSAIVTLTSEDMTFDFYGSGRDDVSAI